KIGRLLLEVPVEAANTFRLKEDAPYFLHPQGIWTVVQLHGFQRHFSIMTDVKVGEQLAEA
ncbi:hypothetical protein ACWKWU_22880, partial [Chitinophaga lutea]